MNIIRANYLPGFDFGYDAVLLTLDGIGVDTFSNAVGEAIQRGSSRLETDGVTHDIVTGASRAEVRLPDPKHVVWQLNPDAAREIVTGLDVLSKSGRQGHVYVDISSPAPTLVLSRDEYLHVDYPWITPPP